MRDIKNNRGFTLIELLAVIIVLTTIALISVMSITNSLYKRDEQECEEQKELARNAAKIYFSFNSDKQTVFVSTLKQGGYFTDKNKTSRLDDGSSIGNISTNYKFNGECK